MLSLSKIGSTQPAAAIGYPNNPPSVVEVAPEDFFTQFKDALEISTDEIESIDEPNKSIKSTEMDDCITLFAIERGKYGISKIIGYHIASKTDFEEMEEQFDENVTIENNLIYAIYLIGGNAASTASGDLLDTIRAAIPKIFKKHCIAGEYLNLKDDNQYISASMQMNGVLTFCRHDRLDM